jgi:hypothetical protein
MYGLSILILLVAFHAGTIAAIAQDTESLTFGEIVAGEVTDAATGASYSFDAADGDVIVIQMQPGEENGIGGADVRVLSPTGSIVADSSAMMVFGRSGELLAAELDADGTYTVTVYNGTGTFNLLVLQAPLLQPDEAIEGSVDPVMNRNQPNYRAAFAVSSSDDYTVEYMLTGGTYLPSLVAHRVDQGGNLFPFATVVNIDGSGQASNWQGGGIRVAGSRDLTIFLVGSLETFFGSTSAEGLTAATFEIYLSPENE